MNPNQSTIEQLMHRSSSVVRIAKPDEPSMKAAIMEHYGNSSVLQVRSDIVQPDKVDKNKVKVKVIAASVNPVDWKTRTGIFMLKWFVMSRKFPKCMGRDLAGIIEKVGPQVSDFKVGDQVYGMPENLIPTYCEHVVCSQKALAKKPTNMTFQEAATVPLAALTAWQSLIDIGKMKAGYKVLVIGGSGGVGNFAVQLCKAKGAICYATCGTHNVDFVKSLGASKVVDYRTQDVVKELQGEKFDIVFDTIGLKPQRDLFFSFVKSGGTLVTTLPFEGDSLTDSLLGVCDIIWKNLRYGIFNWIKYVPAVVWPDQAALNQLRELIEAGQMKTFVDKDFPLDRIREAHEYSEQGRTRGKIAITVSSV